MKIFETIHLLLLAALVIGVPIAATTRLSGQDLMFSQAVKQAGVTVAVLGLLLVLNFFVARLFSARKP